MERFMNNNRLNYIRTVFLFICATLWLNTMAMCDDLKHIVLMETMPVDAVLEASRWFKTQLAELGYKEGVNLKLTVLTPNGDRQKAESLLRTALAKGRPDLVVTNATLASQVAAEVLKDSTIPMVFFTVGAPVKAGLIEKIGIPTGSNITGKVKMLSPEIRLKTVLRLAKQFIKTRPVRVGYIYPTYPSSISDLRKLIIASEEASEIVFVPYEVEYRKVPAGIPEMMKDTIQGIKGLSGKIDFWWESAGPLGETEDFTAALLEHSSVPIAFGHKMGSVKMGALVSLVACSEASGRETALLADAILKGANPGDIAVNAPKAFLLGINLTTALKMNIVIPPDLMELAGNNIFR